MNFHFQLYALNQAAVEYLLMKQSVYQEKDRFPLDLNTTSEDVFNYITSIASPLVFEALKKLTLPSSTSDKTETSAGTEDLAVLEQQMADALAQQTLGDFVTTVGLLTHKRVAFLHSFWEPYKELINSWPSAQIHPQLFFTDLQGGFAWFKRPPGGGKEGLIGKYQTKKGFAVSQKNLPESVFQAFRIQVKPNGTNLYLD